MGTFVKGECSMRAFVKHQRAVYLFSLLSSILLLSALLSCSSSDTRSQAKSSTSGDYEINVQITTPVDGSTVTFADGSTTTEFTAVYTGGTEPVGLNWLLQGPTTSSTSSGSPATLLFQETGPHTITATAIDSRGITGSDSISITVIEGTGLTVTTTTTTTTSTTSTTTTTTPPTT